MWDGGYGKTLLTCMAGGRSYDDFIFHFVPGGADLLPKVNTAVHHDDSPCKQMQTALEHDDGP